MFGVHYLIRPPFSAENSFWWTLKEPSVVVIKYSHCLLPIAFVWDKGEKDFVVNYLLKTQAEAYLFKWVQLATTLMIQC